MRKLFALFLSGTFLAFIVSGCGLNASPIATPSPSTATPRPPTTLEPTATPVPSTATPKPPTPPTDMPILPTETPTETPTATPTEKATPITPTPASLGLKSAAFGSGAMIPEKYARYGEDISPPLEWDEPPEGAQSFVLIVVSDPMPDGGSNWVQWILYNIPADTRTLPEGLAPDADGNLPDGSRHFENSWQELKYGGPAPPHLSTFRYYFTLYALDTALTPDVVRDAANNDEAQPWIGSGKEIMLRAMEGHILAEGKLTGKYKNK